MICEVPEVMARLEKLRRVSLFAQRPVGSLARRAWRLDGPGLRPVVAGSGLVLFRWRWAVSTAAGSRRRLKPATTAQSLRCAGSGRRL